MSEPGYTHKRGDLVWITAHALSDNEHRDVDRLHVARYNRILVVDDLDPHDDNLPYRCRPPFYTTDEWDQLCEIEEHAQRWWGDDELEPFTGQTEAEETPNG